MGDILSANEINMISVSLDGYYSKPLEKKADFPLDISKVITEISWKGTLTMTGVTWDLMQMNEKIGEISRDEIGTLSMVCPDLLRLPQDMRLRFRDGNSLTHDEVMDWILFRITPETQEGVLDKLKGIGIDSYDPWAIICHGNGRSMFDTLWIKFSPELTYEKVYAWRLV